MKKIITGILLLLVVISGGGYILAQKADAAEPGDALYNIDLFAEDVERLLTFNEIKKVNLETKILNERISELDSMSESDADLTEILTAVSAQQDRVRKQLGVLENNPEKYQEQDMEQVRNKYQGQIQENLGIMEKVQNKSEDSSLQIKQQLQEDLENCQSGNCTKKAEEKTAPKDYWQRDVNENEQKGNPNN
ncbi:MAG: DUF5667 domain-containing protein [Candidatus Dojkabacteria bacterium]|jgi:hypothetical protein|nr:DUF5667 domain-containing protein [Candidatus Dojkabacteria bacterium]MDD2270037.1 DUF5667 domain-containing protein [Candidatus Dojkabacteria bacterium]